MIKNERQYRITRAQAEKFEKAVAEMRTSRSRDIHPVLQKAQLDGMKRQLADLQRELAEYDALRSGARRTFKLRNLEELPKLLIQARTAAGLSQEELAGRLGLKPQQIQRYEATEYQSASLERVIEVAGKLGIKVEMNIELQLLS